MDSTLQRVFAHTSEQAGIEHRYMKVAGQARGHSIVLPLRGRGRLDNNLCIVLGADRRTVELRVPYGAKATVPQGDAAVGLDAGAPEVLASSSGERYGQGLCCALDRPSETTSPVGSARSGPHRSARGARVDQDTAKARRIRRFHLGRRRPDGECRRGGAEVKRRVGAAVRRAPGRGPRVVVIEDLSPMRGQTGRRKPSSVVSRWMRSALRARRAFRSQAGGSCLVRAFAAYTGPTCPGPACGYVDKDNRHVDGFHAFAAGTVVMPA